MLFKSFKTYFYLRDAIKDLFGSASLRHKYLVIGEGVRCRQCSIVAYYRGFPMELPHEEDSADIWSVKRQCWKSNEHPAVWTNIPCDQLAVDRPAQMGSGPYDGE